MLCERCKIREATIKYTEIVNGVKTEHNLCSHCAKELDLGQYSAILEGDFPLGKLLSGLLGLEDDEDEADIRGQVVCPTCGTSFDDFVEDSRFGCGDCYGVFDLLISDKMKQLQGSESYKGKQPKFKSSFEKEVPEIPEQIQPSGGEETEGETGNGSAETAALKKEIRGLEAQLKEALQKEDYEQAAQLRDRVRELRKEAKGCE